MNSALDRDFQNHFLGRERGKTAVILCRSPFCGRDLLNAPRGNIVVVGVNQAIMKYSLIVDYNVGSDTSYFNCVNPENYNLTTFVTGFSQERERWLKQHDYPENVWCYTSPPQLPIGHPFPTRDYPRPNNGGQSISSIVALWLAYYMSCDNAYVAGAHFKMDGDRIHGDRDMTPCNGMTVQQIREQYRRTLPQMARQFIDAVYRFREKGFPIEWPGEKEALEVAKEKNHA